MLITRPRHLARALADALIARGAEAIVVPTIEIVPVIDASISKDLTRHAWIALTSANAVESLIASLAASGRDARDIGECKIATIGPATAAAVRKRGLKVDLVCERATSEEFAKELLALTADDDRILLYQARDARKALREALEATHDITVRTAYATRLWIAPELRGAVDRADALTFASSSAIRGFVKNGASAEGKIVVCLGPIVAREAAKAKIHVDAVAEDYTSDGIAKALAEFYTSAKS
ncbi:MAG: uroporphyrinogen-III synthase [Candidatus Eremiobacteraeota bacterium]|nr:uroporphyrinogen-III synthase [Candidatus Eremiobacteraeota bacterium]